MIVFYVINGTKLAGIIPNFIVEMADKSNEKEKALDLCSTCRHRSSCIYILNGRGPVQYCEEFEIDPTQPMAGFSEPVQPNPEEEEPVYGGICKNCGNRKTCMNASPDRIIWHCEEYV
jgi:hypothetical protein